MRIHEVTNDASVREGEALVLVNTLIRWLVIRFGTIDIAADEGGQDEEDSEKGGSKH